MLEGVENCMLATFIYPTDEDPQRVGFLLLPINKMLPINYNAEQQPEEVI